MAFPKKGLRKITVDNAKYAYNITGNDDYIGFSIGLHGHNGQLLTGGFSYVYNNVTNFGKEGKPTSWSLHQRIKVTPDTIRQVIEYGLENGWDPLGKGQMRLGDMCEKVDLNLKPETPFPQLEDGQVALNFATVATGKPLNLEGERYTGEGEIYQVFESLTAAKTHAREGVAADASLECWIMTGKNKAVFYVSVGEEKVFK